MSEGAPDFYHKNNVYIKKSDVNVPVTIEQSNVTVPVNVQNSQIDVNIIGQNVPVDVNVQGGEINANITNSEINTVITGSQVILDVRGSAVQPYTAEFGRNTSPDYFRVLDKWWAVKYISSIPFGIVFNVKVYVKNTNSVSHNLHVQLLPDLDSTPIREESASVDAGYEGWVTVFFDVPWYYPSLIVRIYDPDQELAIGYVKETPYDLDYDSENDMYAKALQSYCAYVTLYVVSDVPISATGIFKVNLFGWNYANKKWVPIQVTSDGKLLAVLG